MEMKLCRKQMERVRQSCGFPNGIEVDSKGLEEVYAWLGEWTLILRFEHFPKDTLMWLLMINEAKVKWRDAEVLQEIEGVAQSYFHKLFSAEEKGKYDYLLSGIDRCVFEGYNLKLTATYTSEEIRDVVFEMGAAKALGDGGFPALFYQKCWHIIGDEVTSFCLQILNGNMERGSIELTEISNEGRTFKRGEGQ
ncbi:hypothetical protein J1N35_043478 [Gossypium stocksii]|uniref:Uncharacterized protein n=1 Tax=Gossypium stocksii TaxID=47602 RepID=A0A9D3U7C5_9ROSI|nr:hypothetical protein J1N35_043478 [Gossypium stocksii]